MPNVSSKTKTIAFRVPNEVYDIIRRRIARSKLRWQTVNEYTKDRVIYDAKRKR